MRKGMVVGNWKMHGCEADNQSLVLDMLALKLGVGVADVAICPPFPYLAQVRELLSDTGVVLGAQNAAEYGAGAYTGEVAAAMLADLGCRYVIIGHSERRQLFGESNDVVAAKVVQVLQAGMAPILCVGETLPQREAEGAFAVVGEQLDSVFRRVGVQDFESIVLAYEPVWAIGTGRTASPGEAQEVHAFLRGLLADRGVACAEEVRILYGGSVKASNAAELFAMPDVDGALVGGASLSSQEFVSIAQAMG